MTCEDCLPSAQPAPLLVLLVGGPLVLGQHSLQVGAVEGPLDPEGPLVQQLLIVVVIIVSVTMAVIR